jgi:hypothetical protein
MTPYVNGAGYPQHRKTVGGTSVSQGFPSLREEEGSG